MTTMRKNNATHSRSVRSLRYRKTKSRRTRKNCNFWHFTEPRSCVCAIFLFFCFFLLFCAKRGTSFLRYINASVSQCVNWLKYIRTWLAQRARARGYFQRSYMQCCQRLDTKAIWNAWHLQNIGTSVSMYTIWNIEVIQEWYKLHVTVVLVICAKRQLVFCTKVHLYYYWLFVHCALGQWRCGGSDKMWKFKFWTCKEFNIHKTRNWQKLQICSRSN